MSSGDAPDFLVPVGGERISRALGRRAAAVAAHGRDRRARCVYLLPLPAWLDRSTDGCDVRVFVWMFVWWCGAVTHREHLHRHHLCVHHPAAGAAHRPASLRPRYRSGERDSESQRRGVLSGVNETLSHNVGVFACVCLASRLTDYWAVFSFTVAGIAVFARPDREDNRHGCIESTAAAVAETLLLFSVTAVAVWVYVPVLLPLLLFSTALSNVVLPALFLRLQHHRQNIYGPWDEARID
ncbi:uncharacterized protein LOC108679432 isoform X2 [Hyalella azteca]|uniref:Uncharacterized protein LOC108679432 isoform X2 n=1 Tax=Hyalella azteca TaxID=294128 RepID=A0A8B7PE21_HYAAZ|nr:uncharacterized protein LOC108679432 isoform X2 [Hyalella azteca]